jgi:plasmid replication initiation protein
MSNEILKYHNDLNTVSMRKWTVEEMDFFFAIIAKVREKGTETIVFDTDELKKLSRFSDKHKLRWEQTMENVVKKLSELSYVEKTSQKIKVMALFQFFEIDIEKKQIEIEVTKRFEYVLNKLQANFTIWELAEFTKIRSTYAKTMYRLIKQWRTIGKKEYALEELKQLLTIPKSYAISDIDKVVMSPIKKELSHYFKGFNIKKIKSNKKGNPVTGYEFAWQAEQTGTWEDNKFTPEKSCQKRKETLPDWVNDTSVPLTKLEESIYKEWYAEQMAKYDLTISEFLDLKHYSSKEKLALQRALKKKNG